MANDIFGGLMKGLGAFMPKDDPDVKLFQSQSEINELQNKEQELYAKIGQKVFPDIEENAEYSDLVAELRLTQKKLRSAREELQAAQSIKTEQEQKEQDNLKSRTCTGCGAVNPEGVKFCQECGTKLNPSGKGKCPECGAEHMAEARFCGECGRKL